MVAILVDVKSLCVESSTNVGEALVVFHCYIRRYMSHPQENSDYCKVDVLLRWCLLASRRRSRAQWCRHNRPPRTACTRADIK
jgi:hypothetical protein